MPQALQGLFYVTESGLHPANRQTWGEISVRASCFSQIWEGSRHRGWTWNLCMWQHFPRKVVGVLIAEDARR